MPGPRLIVEVFSIEADQTRRSLGDVDFTFSALQEMNTRKGHVRPMQLPPLLMAISPDLTNEQRALGQDRRLAIPQFADKLAEFITAIGGLDRVEAYKEHNYRLHSAKQALDEARNLKKVVSRATLCAPSQFDMFATVQGGRDFVSDIEEASDVWRAYSHTNRRPDVAHDDPAYEAWVNGYPAWARQHATPFAFGTQPDKWAGISEETIRTHHEENDDVDLDAILENEMSEHFEDAYDHLEDVKELGVFLDQWVPHAGSGDAIDLSLGAMLATWNAKQHITSYYLDAESIIPAFEGVTLAEIHAWCDANVAKREVALQDLDNSWVSMPEPAPAS